MSNNYKTCYLILFIQVMKQYIILFLFIANTFCAQVYNYDPIRHSNFETNPSFLASNLYHFTSNITHHGREFSPKQFSSTAARTSIYNADYFSGMGAIAGHANLNDTSNYSFAGVGIAYRTIMFGKVSARIGILCKMVSVKSSPGNFDNYRFVSSQDATIKRYTGSNSNISLSFSSPADKYFISGAILNYNLPGSSQTFRNFFPEYYVLNAGDLGKAMNWKRWDINYTAFAKKYQGKQISAVNHFATFLCTAVYLSRISSLRLGTRFGYTDSSCAIASPIIQWNHSEGRRSRYRAAPVNRKTFFIQVMLDLGYDPVTLQQQFKPTPQLNLTYVF
jgi:hypothetical protein